MLFTFHCHIIMILYYVFLLCLFIIPTNKIIITFTHDAFDVTNILDNKYRTADFLNYSSISSHPKRMYQIEPIYNITKIYINCFW